MPASDISSNRAFETTLLEVLIRNPHGVFLFVPNNISPKKSNESVKVNKNKLPKLRVIPTLQKNETFHFLK